MSTQPTATPESAAKSSGRKMIMTLFKGACIIVLIVMTALFYVSQLSALEDLDQNLKSETDPERRQLLAECANLLDLQSRQRLSVPEATRGFNLSVQLGKPKCVSIFIDSGADVNVDVDGKSCVLFAAEKSEYKLVDALLKKGADIRVPAERAAFEQLLSSNNRLRKLCKKQKLHSHAALFARALDGDKSAQAQLPDFAVPANSVPATGTQN